jgi:hypothetical protein
MSTARQGPGARGDRSSFVVRAFECISRVNSTIERFNEQEYAAKAAHIWQLALSGKHNMRRSSEEADPSSESK